MDDKDVTKSFNFIIAFFVICERYYFLLEAF